METFISFRLSVLSSGSSGNATYVETEAGGLLVDAGVSCRRMEAMLTRLGRSLKDVGAVLLTHGHGDHTSGLRSLLRKRSVDVYAAPGVLEASGMVAAAGEPFHVCGLTATFFEVPHDAPTFGLRLSDGVRAATLVTDLGEVTPEVLWWMRGADAAVLEANHDREWLRYGPYSADLKRRISSPRGHLSNEQAAEAAVALAPYGLKDLVLAHLSKKNNSPARACGAVSRALRRADHGSVRVRAAMVGHPTPWIEVGATLESPQYVYRYVRHDAAQQLFEVE
ncbi:MAG TPA: MBL fold metallo-hydrolase [Rubrobacteraceae bacterium]|nr:MBL fold metallo-hydrolase [Rubrobacteraceae bacterium]